uniref:Secreted protein n=1 Tax=Amazona collaria TaxID=241587 RepID=A0A8B9F3B5_9PSIT
MASMGCFCSSFFSISTMSLTPSTTICTCSTSEKPKRSALEMSNTAPTAAVSTPPAHGTARVSERGNVPGHRARGSWRALGQFQAR